jgi:hypothetical protein
MQPRPHLQKELADRVLGIGHQRSLASRSRHASPRASDEVWLGHRAPPFGNDAHATLQMLRHAFASARVTYRVVEPLITFY